MQKLYGVCISTGSDKGFKPICVILELSPHSPCAVSFLSKWTSWWHVWYASGIWWDITERYRIIFMSFTLVPRGRRWAIANIKTTISACTTSFSNTSTSILQQTLSLGMFEGSQTRFSFGSHTRLITRNIHRYLQIPCAKYVTIIYWMSVNMNCEELWLFKGLHKPLLQIITLYYTENTV